MRLGRSRLSVHRFLSGLQKVNGDDLSEEERTCPICKGIYEEDTTLAGDPEPAFRLPCSHVFGAECLRLLFLSKRAGGWEQKLCPLCRRQVYEEHVEGVVAELPRKFKYHFTSRWETLFDYDTKMGDGF